MTPPSARMSWVLRIGSAAAVSAAILVLLKLIGVLDLRLFRDAFIRKNPALGLIVAALLAMTAVALVRYALLLRLVGLAVPLGRVVTASLISQAVGQWAPGSLAVTEVLRFGLMAGLGVAKDADEAAGPAGLKARIALSILIDRLMGLGAMFLVGGLAALALHLRAGLLVKYPALVFALGVASFIAGLGLMAAPLLTKTSLWRKLAKFAAIKAAVRPPVVDAPAPRERRSTRMWFGLSSGMDLLAGAAARPRRLFVPLALSLVIPFLNAATLSAAAQAIGRPIPLAAILVAVPFTIVAVFLPLGLAGYGGPQLAAVAVFGLFEVAPESIVAACLVQNTVVLAVTTLLGGLGAGFAFDRLRAAVRSRRNPGGRSS